ncbi:MAG: HAD family hydrolase [Candidatus Obscuribacterales bacterium]
MPIQALIFDMDGVLVDSEPLHLEAYSRYLASHGKPYGKSHNSQFLGRKDTEIAPLIIEQFELRVSPEELIRGKDEIFFALVRDQARPMPGSREVLGQAKKRGLKVALASSSKTSAIELIVGCLEIGHFFDHLVSGDEVPHGKPAPDIFTLTSKRLSVPAAECLVIEDTENGVRAAKSAGMLCLAVPCDATSHQDHSLADWKLASLKDFDLASLISDA